MVPRTARAKKTIRAIIMGFLELVLAPDVATWLTRRMRFLSFCSVDFCMGGWAWSGERVPITKEDSSGVVVGCVTTLAGAGFDA